MNQDSKTNDKRHSRGRQTRQRLLEAALRLFAEKGYAGVGIREVAAAAATNTASIAFHFSNKDGLYKAVIEYVSDELAHMHRTAIEAAADENSAAHHDPHELVARTVEKFISTSLTSKRSQWMSLLLQREFIDPTDYFTIIYTRAIEPTLHYFTSLLAATENGEQENAERDKVLSFALFIISSAFMRNKNTFLHFIGKQEYTPEDIRLVARVVAQFVGNGLFPGPNAFGS